MILVSQKSILPAAANADDVADRIARRTLAARAPDYSTEVRRLIDAGREVMRRNGTASKAKVADIVAASGLSNDAFYRHFASKDALVAAILDDGTARLRSYLAHQMAKESSPSGKVRRWVQGVLAQATDEDAAATTLAVLWNAGSWTVTSDERPTDPSANAPLATLLWDPFAALGSTDPQLDASLVGHAVVGRLSDHLWERTRPTRAETDRLVAFCLRAASSG
jgi:AcrR family transcriptional regulator